jgi:hypothetical protein
MTQTDGATDGSRSAVKLLLGELTERHPEDGMIVIIRR